MRRHWMVVFLGVLAILWVGCRVSLVWAQNSDPDNYLGSISGTKFADYNGNGLRDEGEPGLSGWTIEIYDENGLLDFTVTNENGEYGWYEVNPGQYYVREVQVDGWTQTVPLEECWLPDGQPLGPCCTIDVGPQEVLIGVNFGNFQGVAVPLDVKPQSCRNPLKFKTTGTLPVAILGAEGFSVKKINMNTVKLEGVPPSRWSMEDVAAPFYPLIGKKDTFDCTTDGPDGFRDVVMHFSMKEMSPSLQQVRHGEVRTIHLTGQLLDGTPILGEDVIVILNPTQ
jgi:hypothetical protein